MDLRKIKKLIELVEESGIAELEVKSGDEAVRIAMPGSGGAGYGAEAVPQVVRTAPVAMTAEPSRASGGTTSTLTAPMAGTFYAAPNPEAEPFVQVGSNVEAGQVVCIIESMKMMHEIVAQDGGTVAEICATNGDPIGTGDTLFRFS